MTYTPEHQFRCTIIRGRSQSNIEDMLPLYADIVHSNCPCTKDEFISRARKRLSKALFNVYAYDELSVANKKTINNHLTEIAGSLLCLYYYAYDETTGDEIAYETESCKYIHQFNDNPTFFKNLCLRFQFPNAAKKIQNIENDIAHNIDIKPYCYVVSLLSYAQSQKGNKLLTQQEVGYYVLNNLDVLQGKVTPNVVYDSIMQDRIAGVKRDKLSGSKDWQHIREQFNWLELANLVETNSTYIWLNSKESHAISLFLQQLDKRDFDAYSYSLNTPQDTKVFESDWGLYYGKFDSKLLELKTVFVNDELEIVDKNEMHQEKGATKSTVDLGDEGEALVYRLEQKRVGQYKERLVNKVLLLGKTKGLGYDISSVEADENPSKPEFARYIEVKSTTRVTEPTFDEKWIDSINLTSKEWIAAEQYGDYYYIYRVYFTKNKTIIVRVKNPFQKSLNNEIEVFPTLYQMNFGRDVIDKPYANNQ